MPLIDSNIAKLVLAACAGFHQLHVQADYVYHEAILNDMLPPKSDLCTDRSGYSYQYEPDAWHPTFELGERENFMVQMNHDNSDPNKSWKMRIGTGGNVYSLKTPIGEVIPDKINSDALWNDAVLQSVAVNTGLNSKEAHWYIHQAGIYQRAHNVGIDNPFFSPSVLSECDDDSCAFVGWGQQAHIPTNFSSEVLYHNRYTDCGNGVIEVSNVIFNAADPSDPNSPKVNWLNDKWGGVVQSKMRDFLIPDVNTNELEIRYPLQSFGINEKIPFVRDMAGYTVFAEDAPIPPFSTARSFSLPCSGRRSCVELVVASDNACVQSTQHPERYTVKCTIEQTIEIAHGCEACYLYFYNSRTGEGVEVPHVDHWSLGEDAIYFHPEDFSGLEPVDVTAEAINGIFSEGDVITVGYSNSFQMPCAGSDTRIKDCPTDPSVYDQEVVKMAPAADNFCAVSSYHSKRNKYLTTVRLTLQPTRPCKSGCDNCILQFINANDPSKVVYVQDIYHWSFNGKYMYFTPYKAEPFTYSKDPKVKAVCTEINSKFSQNDPIIVKRWDSGKPLKENYGMAQVIGFEAKDTPPEYSQPTRLRYGGTSSGKDFIVYVNNPRISIYPGESFVSRQYLILGKLDGIEERSLAWANESYKQKVTIGDIPGRQIELVSADEGATFGVSVGSETFCGGAVSYCTGSSTPQPKMVAHFLIKCGEETYVGPNKFHFTYMTETDQRNYECNGVEGQHPTIKLLGYYPKGECASLMGATYDGAICNTQAS